MENKQRSPSNKLDTLARETKEKRKKQIKAADKTTVFGTKLPLEQWTNNLKLKLKEIK